MIHPVADRLSIARHRVFANELFFDAEGTFVDFDRTLHTSRDGGKAVVVGDIKAAGGYKTVVMIGDGATDMQVSRTVQCPPSPRPPPTHTRTPLSVTRGAG